MSKGYRRAQKRAKRSRKKSRRANRGSSNYRRSGNNDDDASSSNNNNNNDDDDDHDDDDAGKATSTNNNTNIQRLPSADSQENRVKRRPRVKKVECAPAQQRKSTNSVRDSGNKLPTISKQRQVTGFVAPGPSRSSQGPAVESDPDVLVIDRTRVRNRTERRRQRKSRCQTRSKTNEGGTDLTFRRTPRFSDASSPVAYPVHRPSIPTTAVLQAASCVYSPSSLIHYKTAERAAAVPKLRASKKRDRRAMLQYMRKLLVHRRKDYRDFLDKNATRIQTMYRCFRARRDMEDLFTYTKAVVLQLFFRQKKAYEQVAALREARRQLCAQKIQCLYRQRVAKDKVHVLRQDRAAKRIQNAFRVHALYRRRMAATKVQGVRRAYVVRRHVKSLHRCARMIQTRVRIMQARKAVSERRQQQQDLIALASSQYGYLCGPSWTLVGMNTIEEDINHKLSLGREHAACQWRVRSFLQKSLFAINYNKQLQELVTRELHSCCESGSTNGISETNETPSPGTRSADDAPADIVQWLDFASVCDVSLAAPELKDVRQQVLQVVQTEVKNITGHILSHDCSVVDINCAQSVINVVHQMGFATEQIPELDELQKRRQCAIKMAQDEHLGLLASVRRLAQQIFANHSNWQDTARQSEHPNLFTHVSCWLATVACLAAEARTFGDEYLLQQLVDEKNEMLEFLSSTTSPLEITSILCDAFVSVIGDHCQYNCTCSTVQDRIRKPWDDVQSSLNSRLHREHCHVTTRQQRGLLLHAVELFLPLIVKFNNNAQKLHAAKATPPATCLDAEKFASVYQPWKMRPLDVVHMIDAIDCCVNAIFQCDVHESCSHVEIRLRMLTAQDVIRERKDRESADKGAHHLLRVATIVRDKLALAIKDAVGHCDHVNDAVTALADLHQHCANHSQSLVLQDVYKTPSVPPATMADTNAATLHLLAVLRDEHLSNSMDNELSMNCKEASLVLRNAVEIASISLRSLSATTAQSQSFSPQSSSTVFADIWAHKWNSLLAKALLQSHARATLPPDSQLNLETEIAVSSAALALCSPAITLQIGDVVRTPADVHGTIVDGKIVRARQNVGFDVELLPVSGVVLEFIPAHLIAPQHSTSETARTLSDFPRHFAADDMVDVFCDGSWLAARITICRQWNLFEVTLTDGTNLVLVHGARLRPKRAVELSELGPGCDMEVFHECSWQAARLDEVDTTGGTCRVTLLDVDNYLLPSLPEPATINHLRLPQDMCRVGATVEVCVDEQNFKSWQPAKVQAIEQSTVRVQMVKTGTSTKQQRNTVRRRLPPGTLKLCDLPTGALVEAMLEQDQQWVPAQIDAVFSDANCCDVRYIIDSENRFTRAITLLSSQLRPAFGHCIQGDEVEVADGAGHWHSATLLSTDGAACKTANAQGTESESSILMIRPQPSSSRFQLQPESLRPGMRVEANIDGTWCCASVQSVDGQCVEVLSDGPESKTVPVSPSKLRLNIPVFSTNEQVQAYVQPRDSWVDAVVEVASDNICTVRLRDGAKEDVPVNWIRPAPVSTSVKKSVEAPSMKGAQSSNNGSRVRKGSFDSLHLDELDLVSGMEVNVQPTSDGPWQVGRVVSVDSTKSSPRCKVQIDTAAAKTRTIAVPLNRLELVDRVFPVGASVEAAVGDDAFISRRGPTWHLCVVVSMEDEGLAYTVLNTNTGEYHQAVPQFLIRPVKPFVVNQSVEYQTPDDTGSDWHKGVVTAVYNNGTYDVHGDNGSSHTALDRTIMRALPSDVRPVSDTEQDDSSYRGSTGSVEDLLKLHALDIIPGMQLKVQTKVGGAWQIGKVESVSNVQNSPRCTMHIDEGKGAARSVTVPLQRLDLVDRVFSIGSSVEAVVGDSSDTGSQGSPWHLCVVVGVDTEGRTYDLLNTNTGEQHDAVPQLVIRDVTEFVLDQSVEYQTPDDTGSDWHKGVVTAVYNNGTYDVHGDDGSSHTALDRTIMRAIPTKVSVADVDNQSSGSTKDMGDDGVEDAAAEKAESTSRQGRAAGVHLRPNDFIPGMDLNLKSENGGPSRRCELVSVSDNGQGPCCTLLVTAGGSAAQTVTVPLDQVDLVDRVFGIGASVEAVVGDSVDSDAPGPTWQLCVVVGVDSEARTYNLLDTGSGDQHDSVPQLRIRDLKPFVIGQPVEYETPDESDSGWHKGVVTAVCDNGMYDVLDDNGMSHAGLDRTLMRAIDSPASASLSATAVNRSDSSAKQAAVEHIRQGMELLVVSDEGGPRGLGQVMSVADGTCLVMLMDNDRQQDEIIEVPYSALSAAGRSFAVGTVVEAIFLTESDSDWSQCTIVSTSEDSYTLLRARDQKESTATEVCMRPVRPIDVGKTVEFRSEATWLQGFIKGVHDSTGAYDIQCSNGELHPAVAPQFVRQVFSDSKPSRSEHGPTGRQFQSGDSVRYTRNGLNESSQSQHGTFVRYESAGQVSVQLHNGCIIQVPSVAVAALTGTKAAVNNGDADDSQPLSTAKFVIGQEIECRFDGGDDFFEGKITAVNEDGTFNIVYDDGDEEEGVAESMIRERVISESEVSSDSEYVANEVHSPQRDPHELSHALRFREGEEVEARFDGGVDYFEAVVKAANTDGSYALVYDDGDEENAVPQELIRRRGADAVPSSTPDSVQNSADVLGGDADASVPAASTSVAQGDQEQATVFQFHVNQQVECRFDGGEDYFEGTIKARDADSHTYSVLYDDGDVESGVMESLIRARQLDLESDEQNMLEQAVFASGEETQATDSLQPEVDKNTTDIPANRAAAFKFAVGAPIECRFDQGDDYFEGVIEAHNVDRGTYRVKYDDDDEESDVEESMIRARGGSDGEGDYDDGSANDTDSGDEAYSGSEVYSDTDDNGVIESQASDDNTE